MKYLVVLSFGLKKEDGSEFIDIKDEQPWASVPRGGIKPTSDMLKAEVIRWHKAFGLEGSVPRPSAWKSEKLAEWLKLFDFPSF
jgi:hypothetical protein